MSEQKDKFEIDAATMDMIGNGGGVNGVLQEFGVFGYPTDAEYNLAAEVFNLRSKNQ